jgi:hypothetical protein
LVSVASGAMLLGRHHDFLFINSVSAVYYCRISACSFSAIGKCISSVLWTDERALLPQISKPIVCCSSDLTSWIWALWAWFSRGKHYN